MASTTPELQKGKRFLPSEWKALEYIVINGEGGRFFDVVRDRSCASNMARADVWTAINKLFNEVCMESTTMHFD
jgi:hypothetical protein